MSVTFTPQFDSSRITGWNIIKTNMYAPIEEWGTVVATFDDFETASFEFQAHGYDPIDFGIEAAVSEETPELNVSNGNAVTLLRELGIYDGELCGQIDPTDLIDRLVLVGAIDDEGTDPITVGGDGSATMIDCGRRPGTMNRYVDSLRAVAEYAQARGIPVTFA